MPNGKRGDNPLSDFTMHGATPFPRRIMRLLEQIEALGRREGLFPLGEHWPYYPREFEWARGHDLEGAERDLRNLLEFLKAGRAKEILIDQATSRPLADAS